MPTGYQLPEETIRQTVAVLQEFGGRRDLACQRLGIQRPALSDRLRRARAMGLEVPEPVGAHVAPTSPASLVEPLVDAVPQQDQLKRLQVALRRGPGTLDELAQRAGLSRGQTLDALDAMGGGSHNLQQKGDVWFISKTTALGSQRPTGHQLISDTDGEIAFAAIGDTHLGSKYERLDCLNEFYDEVARRGFKTVLHAGNWIDGEAPFNKHDLSVHGMDPQLQYLAKHYPARPGVETWAIAGEDHEGFYSRREGVDIGRYAENVMRQNGRDDWQNLGFMECFLPLVHAGSGAQSKLCLMHPGGGSAYAISYAPQKIVEGFDGGDKPAALVLGHYHKASYNLIRNVHTIQVGCFQDQSLFMRKQKIAAHLGGFFVRMSLDQGSGAILECTVTFRHYFVKGYYEGRWSQHGPVVRAERSTLP
jgi:hypothetical protein